MKFASACAVTQDFEGLAEFSLQLRTAISGGRDVSRGSDSSQPLADRIRPRAVVERTRPDWRQSPTN